MFFVPIDNRDYYEKQVRSWESSHYGLDFSDVRQYAVHRAWADKFEREEFVCSPKEFVRIDFGQELPESYSQQLSFQAEQSKTIYGLAGWYSFALSESVAMSTEPPLVLHPDLWWHPFLPLDVPIKVSAGEQIDVELSLYPNLVPYDPLWKWKVQVGAQICQQSTFDSIPLSKTLLAKLQ